MMTENLQDTKKIEERRSAPHIYLMNEDTKKLQRFEVLDKVEYNKRRFIVLYPVKEPRILREICPETVDEDGEDVVILELSGEHTDRISSNPLDDKTLAAVFEVFKERNQQNFNFG